MVPVGVEQDHFAIEVATALLGIVGTMDDEGAHDAVRVRIASVRVPLQSNIVSEMLVGLWRLRLPNKCRIVRCSRA